MDQQLAATKSASTYEGARAHLEVPKVRIWTNARDRNEKV
jgi:hypothetical protein